MAPKIIVGVETPEAARDALALGTALARIEHAELLLAAVCLTVPGPEGHRYERVALHEAERDLERLAHDAPEGVEVSTKAVLSTSPVRGLHELAEREDARAIVLGPSHLGRVSRAVRGDVTLGMLHAAPCAVAVAPDGYAERLTRASLCVGVAYVDTPEGHEALEQAAELAGAAGGSMRIVHVLAPALTGAIGGDPAALRPDWDAVRAAAQGTLDAAAAACAPVPAETVLAEGDPAVEIMVACRSCDVLVMGSRGYGPARRVLLGSVSSGVVHAAACPVLVLPRGVRVPVGR